MTPRKRRISAKSVGQKTKSLSWYKKRCDIAFSLLVRKKGFCERCGKTDTSLLQHAHVIPRTNLTLRYDIINALCLCYSCHIFFWHKNPLEAALWFETKFPGRYKYLQEVKNMRIKRTASDYKELLDTIKREDLSNLVVGITLDKG